MKNTKEFGSIRFWVREKKPGVFEGICFEFGIVEEGDNPDFLLSSVIEAAKCYLEAVQELDFPDRLLNKKLPASYEKNYKKALFENTKRDIFNDIILKTSTERLDKLCLV